MSLVQMQEKVKQQKLTEGQVIWWPRWLEKYARWTRQFKADRIEIREQPLIQLLQTLRDSGKSQVNALRPWTAAAGIRTARSPRQLRHSVN